MTNLEIQKLVVSAIVKVQSAIHDLDDLPIHSEFTKQMKMECNKMLQFNRSYVLRIEKLLNEVTGLMNFEASESYIEIVKKFDLLGKEINYIEK